MNSLGGALSIFVGSRAVPEAHPKRLWRRNNQAAVFDFVVPRKALLQSRDSSITLRQADDKTIALLKDHIDEIRASGVSLMPEGLEQNIPPQAMADLLAFLKNWRYLAQPASDRTDKTP